MIKARKQWVTMVCSNLWQEMRCKTKTKKEDAWRIYQIGKRRQWWWLSKKRGYTNILVYRSFHTRVSAERERKHRGNRKAVDGQVEMTKAKDKIEISSKGSVRSPKGRELYPLTTSGIDCPSLHPSKISPDRLIPFFVLPRITILSTMILIRSLPTEPCTCMRRTRTYVVPIRIHVYIHVITLFLRSWRIEDQGVCLGDAFETDSGMDVE